MIQFHISKILSRISTRPDINLCAVYVESRGIISHFMVRTLLPTSRSLPLPLSSLCLVSLFTPEWHPQITKVKGLFFSGVSLAQSPHYADIYINFQVPSKLSLFFFSKTFSQKIKNCFWLQMSLIIQPGAMEHSRKLTHRHDILKCCSGTIEIQHNL